MDTKPSYTGRAIKFRRAMFKDGKFSHFKYWGKDIDGATFISPGQGSGFDAMEDQQLTGLKDKNGEELYEGDIVQTYMSGRKSCKFEIRYMGNRFVMWQKGDKSEMDCIWYFEFEIIGNIFQNKKLLKNDPR